MCCGAEPETQLSFSVIMPVRNAASTIGAQLDALASQTYCGWWELVVADNGSTDDTLAIVAEHAKRTPGRDVRIADAGQKRGASHARNAGAAAARGEILAFCDADDIAHPEWLTELNRAAPSGDLIRGGIDVEALNEPRARSWRSTATHQLGIGLNGFLPFASSANLSVRREVFTELGGWDERFVNGNEDVEFSWRAQLNGRSICSAPHALMLYRLRGDVTSLLKQAYSYSQADPLLYKLYRHHGLKRRGLREVAKIWGWILVYLPRALLAPDFRVLWLKQWAKALGRMSGSVRHRVLFP